MRVFLGGLNGRLGNVVLAHPRLAAHLAAVVPPPRSLVGGNPRLNTSRVGPAHTPAAPARLDELGRWDEVAAYPAFGLLFRAGHLALTHQGGCARLSNGLGRAWHW